MSHVRKQIRDQAVTVLTGLATTGVNVFASRQYPFHKDGADLPALCIYSTAEEIQNSEEDAISHIQVRDVLLVIEGYAYGTDFETLDDTLDQISSEVETAIFADQFFNGLAQGTDLSGVEIGLHDGAERPVGVITLIFRVTYLTNEGAPDVAL